MILLRQHPLDTIWFLYQCSEILLIKMINMLHLDISSTTFIHKTCQKQKMKKNLRFNQTNYHSSLPVPIPRTIPRIMKSAINNLSRTSLCLKTPLLIQILIVNSMKQNLPSILNWVSRRTPYSFWNDQSRKSVCMRKWRGLPMVRTIMMEIRWLMTWRSRWLSKRSKSLLLEWK